MAERRRGLGRGLGALIPDVVSDERPVDVFFPALDKDPNVSRETSESRSSKDPAVSMRRARAEKKTPAAGRAKSPKGSSFGASADENHEQPSSVTSKSSSSAVKKTSDTAASKSSAAKAKPSTASTPRSAAAKASAGTAKTGRSSARKHTEESESLAPTDTSVEPAESATPSARATAPGTDVSRETSLESVPGTAFGLLSVDSIAANPRQPRTVFDEDALDELVHSIREVGVLQPIVVRVTDPEQPAFELIMGERRLRASREAGLETIPAIIRQVEDVDLLRDALLENLHRADLNPLEEAAAYQQLLDDFSCTQEELSERIGRSRPQITNTLRLLKLPPLVQRRVAAGVISQGHARAILGLVDPAAMEVLAQRVVAEGLSVRATEEAVVLLNRGDRVNVSRETSPANPELSSIARDLGDRLDTRVNITMGKRKGKISVEFANEDDLKRILQTLGLSDSSPKDPSS